jgi:hypothetical protein
MPQSDADKLLQRLLDDTQSYKTSWIHGPLSVVRTAHSVAIRKYEKTLADQKAVDDLQTEMAITLLIVGAGALFSLAPSAAVLLGTTGTSALARLGNRISQVFPGAVTMAQTFSNRTVVKYIWKNLSKESTSLLKKQGTEEFKKQLSDGLPSANLTGADAEHLYSALEGQVDRIYVHIEDGIKSVLHGSGTEAQKLKFAKETRMSPFMRPVPSLESVRYVLERRFELLMYMNLILDADSLFVMEVMHIPMPTSPVIKYSNLPIKARPLDSEYPSKGEINYKDTGNTVANRINGLVKEEEKYLGQPSKFKFMDDKTVFSSTVNASVMRAADEQARRLMALNDLKALIPMSQTL